MPEVSVTLRTNYLRAPHEEAVIVLCGDVLLRGWRPETRPPGSGIELLLAAEQGRATADAAVDAFLVIIPVPAGERPLGALLARHRELLRRKLLLPLGIALLDLVHVDDLPSDS